MKALKLFLPAMLCGLFFVAGSPEKGYAPGDAAADFHLKNITGKSVSMADYADAKGFIVIFDCNTCPYSKAYNSRIIALNKKYAALGFPVIAINANDPQLSSGDSFDEMVKEARKKNYEFPYLVDESQEVARTYGATNTPHVFVLTRTGASLKVAYIGAIDDSARSAEKASRKYVEEAVDALLAGKPVTTQRTKAIGCGIKWKNS